MCVCARVCVLKKFYSFYIAIVVGIVSGHGHTVEECHRNQLDKSKLALYKPLLSLKQTLKQLSTGNKTEHFMYKGRCDVHLSKTSWPVLHTYKQMALDC